MKAIDSTELPSLNFDLPAGTFAASQEYHAPGERIGWIQAKAEKGAEYDVTIKDALGRVKLTLPKCGSKDSQQFGQLLNLPTMMGEKLKVEVHNVKGAKKVEIFLN